MSLDGETFFLFISLWNEKNWGWKQRTTKKSRRKNHKNTFAVCKAVFPLLHINILYRVYVRWEKTACKKAKKGGKSHFIQKRTQTHHRYNILIILSSPRPQFSYTLEMKCWNICTIPREKFFNLCNMRIHYMLFDVCCIRHGCVCGFASRYTTKSTKLFHFQF